MMFNKRPFRLKSKPDKNIIGYFIFVTIGLLSLVWFVIRTGRKPDRIYYPCQQLAGSNAALFLSWLGAAVIGHWFYRRYKINLSWQKFARALVLFLLVIAGYKIFKISYRQLTLAAGAICPGGNCAIWEDPRVIAVHDNEAVASSSIESDYYNYVDQNTINNMLDSGVLALAGSDSISQAWTQLFLNRFSHDYQSGENIGIKVNWNNSRDDYGSPGLWNPLPQITAALLRQLVNEKGISQDNIYIYDCSERREFYSHFTDGVWQAGFHNVHYVGNTVSSSYSVNKESPVTGSLVDFDNDTHFCSQVENTFDYIINIPLLRAHGNEFGFTLGFKNHFGSIVDPSHLNHYAPPETLLVPLNNSSVIRDKTILTLGNGLYGGRSGNITPPNVIYETLFLSQDPVALDSVMLDHLLTFTTRDINAAHYQYLITAAQSGLGVYEREPYSEIDYIYCEDSLCPGTSPSTTPTPTPPTHCSPLGDIDCSGKVNGIDFGYLVAHWGTADPQANLDDTDVVNSLDALILLGSFGQTSP